VISTPLVFAAFASSIPSWASSSSGGARSRHRWLGDSPSLAGAIELFLTQGMWLESLRLAYLELITAPPPDISALAAQQAPERRVAFVREQLKQYAAPSMAQLTQLASLPRRSGSPPKRRRKLA